MEILNNAHWFVFFLLIFISYWAGFATYEANKLENDPFDGFQVIVPAILNIAAVIAIIYNLVKVVAPNL